ncbi:MAG TPA: TIGR02466 family protein [Gemmataceae bacterium]
MIGGREDWFPTSVWGFEHPEPEPLNASLSRLILTERESDPRGLVDRSTVLGWHSRDDLHRSAEFAPLVQFIEGGVAEAVRFQKWDAKQVTPLIASCWANVNGPGASNVVHTHPHCFLSGVYYVQANADSGAIFFLDPRPAAVMIAPPMTEFTPWTFQRVRYEPKPGRMLIFPSWLQHGVEPNRGADDRICASFNIGLKWKA